MTIFVAKNEANNAKEAIEIAKLKGFKPSVRASLLKKPEGWYFHDTDKDYYAFKKSEKNK